MKKTKIKQKSKIPIKGKLNFKENFNKIALFLLSLAIIITIIIIFKIKPSQNLDTSTTVSTLDTQYIIVKNKEGDKEFKLPIKPAMAKSLGFPATQVTPTIEIQQNVAITTNLQEQKKDYSYLFKPVRSKEEIYRIDIDGAKFLFDSGKALFIDARSISEYEEAHIKGSIPIPLNLLMENIEKYKDKLKNKILVTYCHGIGCHLSDRVAYQLYDSGYRNICIFFSGWPKWVEHKYPVTQKSNEKIIP